MNPAAVVWDAISGFLKGANAILSVVPGLLWALALSAALVHTWWVSGERDAALKDASEAKGALAQLQGAVKAQTAAATKLLKELTDKVLAQQAQLNESHRSQEIVDANHTKTVSDLRADLRRRIAAGSPGLRDPFAAGCGGGGSGPAGAATGSADGSAADGPETGRLLSPEFAGFLVDRLAEADTINVAYASCRADALSVRGLPPQPPPSADPAAPAAPSKGSVP